jgi:hypothetical protein
VPAGLVFVGVLHITQQRVQPQPSHSANGCYSIPHSPTLSGSLCCHILLYLCSDRVPGADDATFRSGHALTMVS